MRKGIEIASCIPFPVRRIPGRKGRLRNFLRGEVKDKDEDNARDSFKDKDGGLSLKFTYDGDGYRISKAVTSGKKTELTRYTWDVNTVLPQVITEADGKDTALYTYGLGRISMTDPNGGQTYYQYDGLGSVRSLSDNRGNTKAAYSYDAFGEPGLTPDHDENDFRFTGEQMDTETGFIYLRARYYDPETGRFITRDPLAGSASSPQTLNRYTYVYNNPARFVDPSGKVVGYLIPGAAKAVLNVAWYWGQVIEGPQSWSWAIAGGRAAGGFSGGEVAFVLAPINPILGGAAAGAVGYSVDQYVQDELSEHGIPGNTEDFSWQDLVFNTGAGAISAGIFPTNPVPNSVKEDLAQYLEYEYGNALVKKTAKEIGVPLVKEAFSYVSRNGGK